MIRMQCPGSHGIFARTLHLGRWLIPDCPMPTLPLRRRGLARSYFEQVEGNKNRRVKNDRKYVRINWTDIKPKGVITANQFQARAQPSSRRIAPTVPDNKDPCQNLIVSARALSVNGGCAKYPA